MSFLSCVRNCCQYFGNGDVSNNNESAVPPSPLTSVSQNSIDPLNASAENSEIEVPPIPRTSLSQGLLGFPPLSPARVSHLINPLNGPDDNDGIESPWITPQEQLDRLTSLSSVTALINQVIPINAICALISSYCRNKLENEVRILRDWYIALEKLDRLPKQIPPLPDNILEILSRPCPDRIHEKKKEDGTSYTIGETCSLILAPQELGNISTINEIMLNYGKRHWFGLRLHDNIISKYANSPISPTHWVLFTNKNLEDSANCKFMDQEVIIANLAREMGLPWKHSNLRDFSLCIFFEYITRKGKSCLMAHNDWAAIKEREAETMKILMHQEGKCFLIDAQCIDGSSYQSENMGVRAQIVFSPDEDANDDTVA